MKKHEKSGKKRSRFSSEILSANKKTAKKTVKVPKLFRLRSIVRNHLFQNSGEKINIGSIFNRKNSLKNPAKKKQPNFSVVPFFFL